MYSILIMVTLCISYSYAESNVTSTNVTSINVTNSTKQPIGCLCGIFLSGQFTKGSKEQPKGFPVLIHEHPDPLPCTTAGNKLCISKCVETIVKYLPNSSANLCASIDRDCYRERAYLFIKNCKDDWINTNLSAGREYCCKNGSSHKCY